MGEGLLGLSCPRSLWSMALGGAEAIVFRDSHWWLPYAPVVKSSGSQKKNVWKRNWEVVEWEEAKRKWKDGCDQNISYTNMKMPKNKI